MIYRITKHTKEGSEKEIVLFCINNYYFTTTGIIIFYYYYTIFSCMYD